jgi:hypothetical protein
MAYCTLADVKAELNISVTTDDSLLSGYITTAQRIIESPPPLGTGRVFEASADTTRYVDAPYTSDGDPDGTSYVLPLWNVGDLCAITTVVNGDGTTIGSSAYVTEPRYKTPYHALRLKRNGSYLWTYSSTNENAIAITGRWAYSTTAPADIARAALRIVVWLYRSRDNANADQATQTDQGIILPNKLPIDIANVLAGYRSLV